MVPRGNQLALECVKTALGEPDDDGRRRPVAIEGSEHEILCGSVIAAVGQRGICEELHHRILRGDECGAGIPNSVPVCLTETRSRSSHHIHGSVVISSTNGTWSLRPSSIRHG